MSIRKLRLQRGWSQEQLSRLSGLSVRTIQRIERGRNPGLESLKSLAAVFEIDVTALQTEADMTDNANVLNEEQQVIDHVRDIKAFYSHLIKYIVVVAGLLIVNLVLTPGYLWIRWVALGWGIGVLSHGLSVFEVFNFFKPDWEKRQIEKRLGRKL